MTLRLVIPMIRPWRWRWLLAVCAGALALAASVALTGTAGWLIATAATHPPVLTLLVATVAVRTFGIARGVLRYAERLLSHDVALRVVGSLRAAVVSALTRVVERGGALGRRSGLLTSAVADADEVGDLLLRGLLPLMAAGSVAVATVLVAATVLPSAGVVLAVCLLVGCVVAPVISARSIAEVERASVGRRRVRDQILTETVDKITDLVAVGAFPAALGRLATSERADLTLRRRSARTAAAGAAVAVLTTGGAVVLTLAVGAPPVVTGGLGPAWLAVLVLMPLALTEMISSISDSVAAFARAGAAGRRLAVLLDEPEVSAPPPTPAGADQDTVVRLRGVAARWPGSERDVISGIDLDLHPGGRVVLVGESGAGKSTLAAVLVGLLKPTAGTITVNDRVVPDLAGLGRVAWADQEAHVFDTSIRQNVMLARPEATEAEFRAALAAAGLRDWVAGLPAGGETPVGENGLGISGGQRQRIALARAFLADRPVLVADEIGAHLDEETAAAVTAAALAPDPRRSVVLITHRPDDVGRGDTVLEMTGGRLRRLVPTPV
ncbi:ATP-binding cassette, subfamily C, CydC [Nakamurella panacisegetis]|uniref:ATP-binding cassette, subfamily C, CydC n=1 Tax=Nakamurella panacisegetis TaxID=1090615 RepID=A0A1H0QF29_9ACTN|nr:thiol reductant ABC exporter subunit CydC [Nakamurella panacisegetis]SDP16001.1 ATP-binding cassette, subfamily C, CydC [Nakamurella panacisegetis]